MAISGEQVISIGLQNESTGSDSLYTAFNKTKDNFATLFACASPYNTFNGNGVTCTANSITGNVDITNTGVTNIAFNSNSLAISGSPVTTTGNVSIELQANVAITGKLNLSGSQVLTNGQNANLNVTASYFSTTGATVATLLAGTSGLIKTFMMSSFGGNMVITVTHAAWGGSGTMTFSNVGAACTLQYIDSKWFCIGNNGVVFE